MRRHCTLSKIAQDEPAPITHLSAQALAQAYTAAENVTVNEGAWNACSYDCATDTVRIPSRGRFETEESWWAVLFGGLVRSTAHRNRLARETGEDGENAFGREALVAEIGSAMLCGMAGLETERTWRDNAGCIQGWMRALSADNRLFYRSAALAERAVKRILSASGLQVN